MKFEKQYNQYIESVHAHASTLVMPYVEWLESLVTEAVVTIEVNGGVAEMAARPRFVWVVIKDYDNKTLNADYSEEIWCGW